MKPETQPRLPNVGEYVRGEGTLIAIQDTPPPIPPPPIKDYIFEQVTARIEVRLGDEILKTLGTLWDFFGKETSVSTAIKDAKEYAAEHKIDPASQVEVVVVKIVGQVRKHQQQRESHYDKAFYKFESPGIGRSWDLPDDTESVVWSSKNEKT